MAMTPEGRVKHAIKAYLGEVGAWYYMPVSNGMGRSGCPDILVCFAGMFYALEVKAPGKIKNTTPNQDREIDGVNKAGGIAVIVDDVSQVKELFEYAKSFRAGTAHQSGVQPAS